MDELDLKEEIFFLILWGIVQISYLKYPCPSKFMPLIPCLYHLAKSVYLGINIYKERWGKWKK
ncbi:hypothetical protein B5F07_07965 [Lachnoclostridium sp. An169]|uniref:hypothetical protein n=1 Tax=Lachnoclostridium sp. An169 TaxID=1965569 RepID=UPI000B3B0263|nr:hypothetical protein [Lachnoclostridium sp. An169]OUP84389.1 hypothetical protein B5F07_07965 [Lachnoclostridium sp. An169]